MLRRVENLCHSFQSFLAKFGRTFFSSNKAIHADSPSAVHRSILRLVGAGSPVTRSVRRLLIVEMITLRDIRVACLTFGLIVAGCHAKPSPNVATPSPPTNQSPNVRQQSPLSSVAQEIQRRGYSAKGSFIEAPTPWEASTFRMRSKQSVSFRANQPQAGSQDYFVRFWFFEETYDSIEDARNRLANLHLRSPDADAQVNEYDRVMRSGFRVGTIVYFLQTDAIIFWDETRSFTKELARATHGVELTL